METEKEQLAAWMIANGFATGHGETTADLLAELTWQVAEERGQRALYQEAFELALFRESAATMRKRGQLTERTRTGHGEFQLSPEEEAEHANDDLDLDKDIRRPELIGQVSAKPISLKQCALAYCRVNEEWDMNYFRDEKPHLHGIEMAKAVLSAAGVSYVDDLGPGVLPR